MSAICSYLLLNKLKKEIKQLNDDKIVKKPETSFR